MTTLNRFLKGIIFVPIIILWGVLIIPFGFVWIIIGILKSLNTIIKGVLPLGIYRERDFTESFR